MQQCHLGLESRLRRGDPVADVREHRVARGLGRHADEDTAGTETRREDLGGKQSRLGLALSHRRLDHHQTGAGHAPRDVDNHRL